ncbi:ABC-2 type transport system permease protein [Lactobacillus colini]|uniref:ABC-2 type transport system permease protein n=1 Tax=Lactobacillus colini TaxID=1819254 RepID=A0ABS4MHD7_9LACO|nr:ABC transporter permease [Lactobacillus colini]MBP2058756.1 ABC-2 type transport system permease protein [Lactobacillus colini]
MNRIVNKRLQSNQKKQLHYLTLVFNDFFILALIFMFGALMFWYAKNIKSWPNNLWFYKPLIALILATVMSVGHLATLFEKADIQFMLNQDDQMQAYLNPMIKHSMYLPTLLIILVAGILFPFALTRAGISNYAYWFVILGLILTKFTQLKLISQSFYFNEHNFYQAGWFFLVVLVILILCLIYLPYLYFIFALISAIGVNYLPCGRVFNWNYAVEYEERRRDIVDNFYSMFTDVQDKKVKIYRRKYLDFLLDKKNQTPNTFLYQRALLRDPEYSNLLIRMTLFSLLLTWVLQDYLWAGVFGGLVIFLTMYQLIPLGTVYEHNMMYHVQPISQAKRGQDLARVLQKGMLLQWLVISLGLIIFSPMKLYALLAIVVLLAFTFILLYLYLPVRIKQLFSKIRY